MSARSPLHFAAKAGFPTEEQSLKTSEITSFTNRALVDLIEYVSTHSPYYKRLFADKKVDVASIDSAEKLAELVPLTTKQHLAENSRDFWCVDDRNVAEISTTTGTTGEPTLYPMTARDLERLARNEHLSFSCAGVSRHDTVLLAVTMDRYFIAGLAYYLGLQSLGAAVARCGSASPHLLLSMLERVAPTVIVGVPSFLKRVAEVAANDGIDLANSSVKKLVCIGEPIREPLGRIDSASKGGGNLNPVGRLLKNAWGAELFATYGITELAASSCECSAGLGGHIHPELLHVEIVDENGAPVPDGEPGEIVATTLGVEAMPLLRYATGDVDCMWREPCTCGLNSPRLGPILGRKQQLLKIKGTSVYPSAVQRVLDGRPEVLDYVMIATANSALSDELEVVIAVEGDKDAARRRIVDELQGELKVRPNVRIDSRESIAKRQTVGELRKRQIFLDQRPDTLLKS